MINEKEKAIAEGLLQVRDFSKSSGLIAFGFDAGIKAERERIKNILDEKLSIRIAVWKELFPNEGGEA